MTTRQAFIAATALAVAGTAGMASWLALSPGEIDAAGRRGPAVASQGAVPAAGTEVGIAETEAAVLPPPAAADDAPQAVSQPGAEPARRRPVVERVMRTEPAARPAPVRTRTPALPAPVSAPEPEPEREPEPARTEPVERPEPVEPVEPIELVIASGSVLGVRLESGISSETAAIEDRVEAFVTRDVMAGGRIAVPAGTRLVGSVNEVARGGKFREAARLGVRFHTLVMDDGARVPVQVDSIVREGSKPARSSATKIGASAVGGAIIGGIMGGKKGALLGGAAGAGAGTAVVATGDRSVAELVDGAQLSLRLLSPVTVMIERR